MSVLREGSGPADEATVLVTGTAGGHWRDLAAAAWCCGPESPDAVSGQPDSPHVSASADLYLASPSARLRGVDELLVGSVDERAWRVADEMCAKLPGLRALVFVESPTIGLAAALAADPESDVGAWLDGWRASARALLRLGQRRPERCLFIDASEAHADPAALAAQVSQRLGLAEPGWPRRPAGNGLAQALAELSVQADAGIRQLLQSLSACCVPLTAGAIHPAPSRPALDLVRAAALEWAGLAKTRRASEQRVAELESAVADQVRRHVAIEADRAAAQSSLQVALGETELLRLQLAQLHDELEEQHRALLDARDRDATRDREVEALRRSLERAHEEVRLAREAAARAEVTGAEARGRGERAEIERDMLARQLDQVLAELDAHFDARRQAEADLARQASDAAALKGQLELLATNLQRESEAAQRQAVRAQRLRGRLTEAEQQIVQDRREIATLERQAALAERRAVALEALRSQRRDALARDSAARAARVASGRLDIREIAVADERDEPPLRQLTLHLRGLALGTVHLEEATVRLIERHGLAGLVVFDGASPRHWLGGWQETGREGGAAFALLMPGDPVGQAALDRLTARDWTALTDLVSMIETQVEDPEAGVSVGGRWADVARRLSASLAELPARVRFDRVSAVPAGEGQGVEIRISGLCFRARRMSVVRLRWLRHRIGGELELLPDGQGRLPLLHLPMLPEGEDGAGLRLPLGSGLTASARAARWAAIPPADREFVAALLEALAGAAASGGVVDRQGVLDAGALAALVDDARGELDPGPGRWWQRGTQRRVGGWLGRSDRGVVA